MLKLAELKKIPFYPFGFAAFPALFLYSQNISQVPLSSFGAVAGVCVALSLILFALSYYACRNIFKSSLIVFCTEIFIFFYGRLYDVAMQGILDKWLTMESLNKEKSIVICSCILHMIFLSIVFALLALVIKKIIASKKEFLATSKPLNVVVWTLLILSSSPLVPYFFGSKLGGLEHEVFTKKTTPADSSDPDIYYIILDGYTRADKLWEAYCYDNGPFVQSLEALGFYVAKQSKSNYAHTELSLPSSLNMQYLDDKIDAKLTPAQNNEVLFQMISDNALLRFLKSKGYRYVHMDSIWSATMRNRSADVEISYHNSIFQDEFCRLFIGTTILKVFDYVVTNDLAETHLYNFERMADVPFLPGPKFVFAHFLLPHNPFLFGRHGEIKQRVSALNQWDSLRIKGWRDPQGYIDQLAFTSTKVVEMVEQILANSKKPPIIVIQGDHGFNLEYDVFSRKGKDLRMSILNAYYLPGDARKKLYPTITPVNSFRLICDYYLGSHFGSLEDSSYFSSPEDPCKLEPWTS